MISVDYYMFSLCNYSRVVMDDGDVWPLAQLVNAASFGVVVQRGRTAIVAADDNSLVGHTFETLPAFQPTFAEAFTVRSMETTEWVCVSRNGAEREVAYQPVDAVCTVPANWGFIVISGEVDVGGTRVARDQLYLPRDHEVVITSAAPAELLLIR